MTEKPVTIFGRSKGIALIVITSNLEFIPLCQKEETLPIPLRYIDATRTTHTNLDVLQESHGYWNIDASEILSEPWTGFTQFTILNETLLNGYMWSGRRLAKISSNFQT